MLGLAFGDQVKISDARYMHYSQHRKPFVLKDDIHYRQYYNEVGDISHLQVILPVQLLATLLKSLYGTAGKHPGTSQIL